MSYARKVVADDGTYTVYLGNYAVRLSLTSAEADEVLASLSYLKAPREWGDAL